MANTEGKFNLIANLTARVATLDTINLDYIITKVALSLVKSEAELFNCQFI
jgi:hypothetical protein